MSDEDLVARAAHGDRPALLELLERHGPEVRRRIQIPDSMRGVLSADDVMQEAYTDAVLDFARFRPRGERAFRAWLTTIARNRLIDAVRGERALRRGGGAQRVGTPSRILGTARESAVHDARTPSRAYACRERKEGLECALAALPAHYASVVRRCLLGGERVVDVARSLGKSEGAVSMTLVRALKALRRALGSLSRLSW